MPDPDLVKLATAISVIGLVAKGLVSSGQPVTPEQKTQVINSLDEAIELARSVRRAHA